MPTYKVILLPTALDSLKGIDQEIGSRILDKLEIVVHFVGHRSQIYKL